jgi:predicted TIM-barrel fold metal-dependent hydrolase
MIFDSDMHVIEPADLFTSVGLNIPGWGWNGLSIPRASASVDHKLPDAPSEWPVDPDAYVNGIASSYAAAHADDFGPASTLMACRREGITGAVLFPTRASSLAGADDVPLGLLVRGLDRYNDWVREFATQGAPVLSAVGAFSMQDPPLARRTIERCGKAGFGGMVTRPNPMCGRRWDHPDYAAVFDALVEYRLPLILHEGTGAHLPTLGLDRANTYLEAHAMSHTFEAMSAVLQFTVGGIFARHPELRVGFFECGAGWLPYWLDRLDDHALGIFGAREYRLKQRPSFYFKRQGFVTMEPSEELHGIQEAGLAENVLFASDYPHGDSIYPYSVRTARAAAGELWGKVSRDNAARFWLPR